MKFNSIFSHVVIVKLLAGYWSDTIGQTADNHDVPGYMMLFIYVATTGIETLR